VKRKAAERLADLIDPDRLLRETASLAYLNPKDLYDEQGRLRPIHDLPDHVAAAIAGIEVVRGNVDKGDGQFDTVLKVKHWDKTRAIDMLMRHLALYKDRLNIGLTPDAEKLVARLGTGRERVARAR
jgi:phage terminase small subunit